MSANIKKFDLEYSFGDTRMRGYFATPAENRTEVRSKIPGILIVHDAFGLDSFCIGVTDTLAQAGFAALAVDLWGGRRQFTNASEDLGPALTALTGDRREWMGRVEAARQSLITQIGVDATRIAAIGYCLGGSTVLEFARQGGDMVGAVSFHGGLEMVGAEWDNARTKAKLLACTGAEDPLVPWAVVSAFKDNLRKAGVNWELDVYANAKHSFTRPDASARSAPGRSAYDAQAARRAWRAMGDFLNEVFEERR